MISSIPSVPNLRTSTGFIQAPAQTPKHWTYQELMAMDRPPALPVGLKLNEPIPPIVDDFLKKAEIPKGGPASNTGMFTIIKYLVDNDLPGQLFWLYLHQEERAGGWAQNDGVMYVATSDFYRESLTPGGLEKVADWLRRYDGAVSYDLSAKPINETNFEMLCNEKRLQTCTVLKLSKCNIDDTFAGRIGAILVANPNLTSLSLNLNKIGSEGAKAAFAYLPMHTGLTYLDISVNPIKDEGAGVIFEALKINKTLTKLVIGKNEIGNEGAKHAAKMLESNTTLTELNLSINTSIKSEGFLAISEALKSNVALQKFFLNEVDIDSPQIMPAIRSLLRENSTLTMLQLSFYAPTPEECLSLKDVERKNASLIKLKFLHERFFDKNCTENLLKVEDEVRKAKPNIQLSLCEAYC